MSGVEVLSIISGIIAVVDATVKIYAAATDASGLPEAFSDVAMRLPLVQDTLQKAWEHLNTNPDEVSCNAMKPVLKDCEDKADRLRNIFAKVVPPADASRMERYLLAARTLGKGDTVESLMKGILDDIRLLTSRHVTNLPTGGEIADQIRTAIEGALVIRPSLPADAESSSSRDAERDALLRSLKWTDPCHDKARIERTKGGLYEDASRWILDHPSYRKWQHHESKILWIKGDAGKGKTMLLVTAINELRPCTRLDRPDADTFLSFFFCQNTDDRLNNAVAVLKGLIYLLLVQDSNLVPYLKSDYDRMGKEAFDSASSPNAFDALSDIFRRMILQPRSEIVYLAVDALDECTDGRPDLLNLIKETSLHESHVKWIVTSRNYVKVDESLALSLEVNSVAVRRAIEVYIGHKVSQIATLRSNPTQRIKVQQTLLEKAEGTFLWVDLVLRSIHGALADDIVRLIDEIPKGLPPLYDRMMRNIENSESGYQAPCLAALSVVTLAYRPLHLLELRTLAGLDNYDTPDLEQIIDQCGSFLTLLESKVYPIHQSAKDYLVSEAAVKKIFTSGPQTVHRCIADRSVAAMTKVLTQDVYNLAHPGTFIEDVKAPTEQDPLLGVGYPCAHWIDHVCEAYQSTNLQRDRRSQRVMDVLKHLRKPSNSEPLHNLVTTFIQKHFLHWLEALSLLGVITNGVFSLTRLRNVITPVKDMAFVELIEEAYRFILFNRWIIERAPLQTYVSALLFAPSRSKIRDLFRDWEPTWVIQKPAVEQLWSPCLQIFEGHGGSVTSVAFSPDGSRIVSGSDDNTVRIWDAKSGKEVRKLEGHDFSVTSVAFSPDGSRIVSGSHDNTVRIWDAKSGKEVRKLEGHDDWVRSVAFSPDGSRIVSGSHDNTVRIWDAKSGKEVRKLEGHVSSVTSVAFSPDGSRIVSGSHDNTVRIWDAKSGKEVRKLEGHDFSVTSVAFSPDGSRIVSGSHDKTVRIWDAKSGKEVRKLEGHDFSVRSVAFSPDGSRIVSGSHDKTVRIWDAKSGKDVHKLEGKRPEDVSSLMMKSSQQLSGDQQSISSDEELGWGFTVDGSWVTCIRDFK